MNEKFDKVLTVILAVILLICIAITVYLIISPKPTEKFTEFYILGPEGKAADYPTDLKKGERVSVIIGVVNHEGRTINYTIAVWLVNQSFSGNKTHIYHIYLMKVIRIRLKPIPYNPYGNWTPEWQKFYNFSINKTGKFKIWFILFKKNITIPKPENGDFVNTDVKNWIIEAINNTPGILSLNLNVVVRK